MKINYKDFDIKDFNISFFKNNAYEEFENILLTNYVIFSFDDDIIWGVYNNKISLAREFRNNIGYLIVVYNYLSPYTHLNILRHLESYHE